MIQAFKLNPALATDYEVAIASAMQRHARSEGHRRALPQGRNRTSQIAKETAHTGRWAALAKTLPKTWTNTVGIAEMFAMERQATFNALQRMAHHGMIEGRRVKLGSKWTRQWRAAQ